MNASDDLRDAVTPAPATRSGLEGPRLARAAAILVIATGALALVGWAYDLPVLTSILPGLSSMKANTAVAFLLCGLSLWLSEGSPLQRRAGALCATVVAGISLATLTEYLTGWDLGIDELLVRDHITHWPSVPGRMGSNTATCFGLVAAALARMRPGADRRPWIREACALAAAIIALTAVIGYAYSAISLTGISFQTQMALHTALAFLVLCTGVLARDRRGPVLTILLSDGPGGEMTRTVLPTMLVLLFGFGWLRLKGQDAGWYGTNFGLAIMVLVSLISLSVVTLLSAARLNRLEAERRGHALAMHEYAQLLDLAHVMIRSQDGTIRLWNTGSEHLYGWSRTQAVGRLSHQLLQTEFPEPLAEIEAQLLQTGHWQGELVRRHAGGQPITVASHWVLHRDATNTPVGVLEVNNDITERKHAETEMRRSNEELERFAYIASHDLQEPLRMVGSYVQLLAKRYKGKLDADADDFIGFALDGTRRMHRLIEDLLAYSRVGSRGAAMASVNANAALDGALRSLRLAIEESGAVVTHDQLPTVLADPGQVEHLFLNLVSNALKFRAAAPPLVHISAARDGDRWEFSVRDNGIGIAPEYFERIFVIFQRLHGRDDYPGTGIGLAIAKKIVERHGGQTRVESQPGQGATFLFTLPAVVGV